MCLIAFAWRSHARYPLAMIANRDELHARPAARAGFHPDDRQVFGGRDLQAGGSWLLLSTQGRIAAVTNVRVGRNPETAPRSRGALVADFVRDTRSPADFLDALAGQATEYGRFNLLVSDGESLHFASNHPDYAHAPVAPGVHRLSNGPLDADWPKARRAERALQDWLKNPVSGESPAGLRPLFSALADTLPADDDELPDTGVGLELERLLSSPFIAGHDYGTRCSTVVLVGERDAHFVERRFGPGGGLFLGETRQVLPWLRSGSDGA